MANNRPDISLVSLVLFAACGILVFIIIFLFVKRQISRFSLKSKSKAHEPIAGGAPKAFKTEIWRKLYNTTTVKYEPTLVREENKAKLRSDTRNGTCHYYYRMKALDAVALLDTELKGYSQHISRKPQQDIRQFLMGLRTTGPLKNASTELVENFSRAYEHARHDPEEFSFSEYNSFMDLLKELINCVLVNKEVKDSPNKRSVKRSKNANQNATPDILMHHMDKDEMHRPLGLHIPLLHVENRAATSLLEQLEDERESLLGDDEDNDTLINDVDDDDDDDDDDRNVVAASTTSGTELKPLMGLSSLSKYYKEGSMLKPKKMEQNNSLTGIDEIAEENLLLGEPTQIHESKMRATSETLLGAQTFNPNPPTVDMVTYVPAGGDKVKHRLRTKGEQNIDFKNETTPL